MSHEEWMEYADVFALGALDGEELTRFEDHIAAGCPDCDRHIRESREVIHRMARSLPSQPPPPEVKRRLMDRLDSGPRDRRTRPVDPRRRPAWSRLGLAASLLLLAGLFGILALDDLSARRELGELRSEGKSLRARLTQQKEVIRLLDDPEVRTVALTGLAPSPRASGRVLWRPADRTGLLLARGLPRTSPGKAYALWAIAARGPVPAGLFTVDDLGRAQVRLPRLAAPEEGSFLKFAITLEPAAGVPTPTGPMHLIGSMEPEGPA